MLGVKQYEIGQKDYTMLRKSGDKISGETGRPAQEDMIIDRKGDHKVHVVKELDESGTWQTVHYENEPLRKTKNQAAKDEDRQTENEERKSGSCH